MARIRAAADARDEGTDILTLLSASMKAMQEALAVFKAGEHPENLLDRDSLRDVVGFNDYYAAEERYSGE